MFWDLQAGRDGKACASCHFHVGADARITNQLSPGYNDIMKGPDARHELMIRRAINFRMIQLKNISVGPQANHPAYFVPRVVCTSSQSESVGAVEKVLLEDRIGQFHRGALHNLVFKGGIEKLSAFQTYCNRYRAHGGIGGIPPEHKRGPATPTQIIE
jgi:hypothetical protein